MNKWKMDKWLAFYMIAVIFNSFLLVLSDDKWIEPNIWRETIERDIDVESECVKCNFEGKIPGTSHKSLDDNAASIYYTKFVRNLFHRNKLKYNAENNIHKRVVVFTLTEDQLTTIENFNDPRDLDSILTEIFRNEQSYSECTNNVAMSIKDVILYLNQGNRPFFILAIVIILILWYIHHRYHIGIIALSLSTFIIFGYFHTYLECNEKLELDQMVEIQKQLTAADEISNGWFSFLKVSDSIKTENLDKRKVMKYPFCRPDHVALQYFNEMFLKQIEILVEKITKTFVSVMGSIKFPYNLLAGVGIILLKCYILKLIFKYTLNPKAWFPYFHASHWYGKRKENNSIPDHSEKDRISGDNLRALLDVLSNANATKPVIVVNNNMLESKPSVSGVQEITEQIEAVPSNQSTKESLNDVMEDKTDANIEDCLPNDI